MAIECLSTTSISCYPFHHQSRDEKLLHHAGSGADDTPRVWGIGLYCPPNEPYTTARLFHRDTGAIKHTTLPIVKMECIMTRLLVSVHSSPSIHRHY